MTRGKTEQEDRKRFREKGETERDRGRENDGTRQGFMEMRHRANRKNIREMSGGVQGEGRRRQVRVGVIFFLFFCLRRSHARECQRGDIISKPCVMSA